MRLFRLRVRVSAPVACPHGACPALSGTLLPPPARACPCRCAWMPARRRRACGACQTTAGLPQPPLTFAGARPPQKKIKIKNLCPSLAGLPAEADPDVRPSGRVPSLVAGQYGAQCCPPPRESLLASPAPPHPARLYLLQEGRRAARVAPRDASVCPLPQLVGRPVKERRPAPSLSPAGSLTRRCP